ncbi:MAG: HD-GYP domain-containing protein [Armatimonadota bacterium]
MVALWARLTLLQRFTAASAAIAVALAVMLSVVAVRAIQSVAVKDEAQVAAELVLRTLSPQLRASDFHNTFPLERRTLLDALFRAHGISDKILRVRLWHADGRLLYSNVPEPKLVAVRADLSASDGYRQFVLRRQGMEEGDPGIARVFVPVQVAGNPQTVAAFEIFYDLTVLNQRLVHLRRTIWFAVPLGLFILYGSVFVLVRRASRQLLKQHDDLIAAHLGTYQALAGAIDAKDSYTGDHSTSVATLAADVGRALGLESAVIEDAKVAARLHDVGKIGVPDAILMKPGPLTPEEWVVMQKHAEAGFEILRHAPLPNDVKQAVLHSHERWDGNGYPDRLAGQAIPLLARIVAVVDAFEAMTGDRPYRKGLTLEEAFDRLKSNAGTQFDPNVVRAFLGLMERTEWKKVARDAVRGPHAQASPNSAGTAPVARHVHG